MGYLNDKDGTVQMIDDLGWYHTTIIGKTDAENFVFFTDGKAKGL